MDEAIAIPCPMCRTVTHVSSASDLPRNWSLIYGTAHAPQHTHMHRSTRTRARTRSTRTRTRTRFETEARDGCRFVG
jgi:hypothetical protein